MKKFVRLTVWACLLAALACSKQDGTAPDEGDCPPADPLTLKLPAGFPVMPIPKDNPLTRQGVYLGRLLFYDPILSGDSTQACGSCHDQLHAFSDPRRFSVGIHGTLGNRNAPTIVNPGWNLFGVFWDGRAEDLEEQATMPVPNTIEMDLAWADALKRLKRHHDYPGLFCAAFGDDRITIDRVVKAIAQFERTFISGDAKYDRVRRGEDTFTPEEQAGLAIFASERGDCFHCHDETLFATGTFHNTGLDSVVIDRGRADITGNPADIGKFKSPTLRNITESAPYMHDGRFNTLREVIDHYNMGFHDSPDVDPLIRARLTRLPMTEDEITKLTAFLQTLTDPDFLANPKLSNPYLSPPPPGP